MRFCRFSLFLSSAPLNSPFSLSHSSVPRSVAGVPGAVLGVAARLGIHFGRSLRTPVHFCRPCPGLPVEGCNDGGDSSAGDDGTDSNVGDRLCGSKCMLRERDSVKDRWLWEALGRLLSSE